MVTRTRRPAVSIYVNPKLKAALHKWAIDHGNLSLSEAASILITEGLANHPGCVLCEITRGEK